MAEPPVMVIAGRVDTDQVSALCERVRVLVAEGASDMVVCDVSAVARPDLGTVDALARVALTARRLGCQVDVRNAPRALRGLLALAGLAEVVPCGRSAVEPQGQTEHREEPLGVEEERDPADPAG